MIMRVSTLLMILTSLSAAGCTLDRATPPSLTGPSTFATSLIVTATPDAVVLNGQQSVVTVEARDATGGPLANLRITLDTNGCGSLSLTDVTTGSDGRAAVVFTTPTLPLPMPECSSAAGGVTIVATAVGTNAQVNNSSSASIRFLAPSSGTAASVFAVNFSITKNAGTRDFTFADAGSVSPGHSITSFRWNWSDGATELGSSVTHDFLTPGTYTVTLTITDDIGQSGSKTALLTVN
jgi:hypothetical protein